MAHKFPSAEWVAAFKDAVNGNPAYKASGREWTHGVITLVVSANPGLGLAEDTCMWLDLHQGVCRDAKIVGRTETDAGSAFVIVGDYARWKQVIRKELEPIKGLMQGKLKLAKGQLPVIVRFVQAARDLVESATMVPTTFLGD
ncbi:MAG: SCP2 sterol-binding domain-containing protein [Deltaproteobacteria bacterium]|nr:SCP2 sterol-binding domain-containing protein [Deltaproteobacteria bacterium]